MRERFVQSGLGALQDHEILELLLSYGHPRKDTKAPAKELRAWGCVSPGGTRESSPGIHPWVYADYQCSSPAGTTEDANP